MTDRRESCTLWARLAVKPSSSVSALVSKEREGILRIALNPICFLLACLVSILARGRWVREAEYVHECEYSIPVSPRSTNLHQPLKLERGICCQLAADQPARSHTTQRPSQILTSPQAPASVGFIPDVFFSSTHAQSSRKRLVAVQINPPNVNWGR